MRNSINCSSHNAVIAILGLHLKLGEKPYKTRSNLPPRIKWNNVNTKLYYELTDQKLSALYNSVDYDTPMDLIVARLDKILYEASTICHPVQPKKRRQKTKFTWSAELIPYMKHSKHAYARWKNSGCPTDAPNELYLDKKQAKQQLRQAQRRIASRERAQTHAKIMQASESDQITFHRLIRNQRAHPRSSVSADIDFTVSDIAMELSPADQWANYFTNLATPKHNTIFDQHYKDSADLQRLLIRSNLRETSNPVVMAESYDIQKHIDHLKNQKASDACGIAAEHVKLASPVVTDIVTLLVNRILNDGKLPDSFKHGLVTPVHKKEKPVSSPDSYRRITVASLIGKVVEKELNARINHILRPSQSIHQFGFTEGASSNNAAMLLTEVLSDARIQRKPVYVTYMDASKAFDVVDHSSVLRHLYDRGVRGNLWLIMDSMYTGCTSAVKWDGIVSLPFAESQGIRQGGVSSTCLFNNRSTSLLEKLASSSGTLRLGHIPVGAIMCADDLALLSDSTLNMQCLVNEAAADASRERFTFSETKTKIMTMKNPSARPNTSECVQLYGSTIQEVNQEKHLGIMRTADGRNRATIDARIQLARRTAYGLMGAGLHGLNGVSPGVNVKILNTYVTPRLTFGLEALILNRSDIDQLENFYRTYLRSCQHLPNSTANAAIYLLVGAMPMEGQLHVKLLNMVASMSRRSGSLEREILERQFAMNDSQTKGWVAGAQTLLNEYHLPSIFQILRNPPTKYSWCKKVKKAVSLFWEEKLKDEAKTMSSLSYLVVDHCKLGHTHRVWNLEGLSSLEVMRATVKVKLLVSRYPLHSCRVSGQKYNQRCPLCQEPSETVEHFLLTCPALTTERDPLIEEICALVADYSMTDNPQSLTQLLLDCSDLIPCKLLAEQIEILSRKLCFTLHNRRSVLIGYGSQYMRVSAVRSTWL